jgi:hypothetical protein
MGFNITIPAIGRRRVAGARLRTIFTRPPTRSNEGSMIRGRFDSRARCALLATALFLPLATPPRAAAQSMASEHGATVQTVDGTTITVEYYRPKARGRELFGKLVPWGVPWTPGANWATTIEVNRDVRIAGKPLPKGKYTIWAVPQAAEWTIIFDRRPHVFHVAGPSPEQEQMRVTVKPVSAAHTEMLTWWFPDVQRDATTLQLQWGETAVPLPITVTPPQAPPAADAGAPPR